LKSTDLSQFFWSWEERKILISSIKINFIENKKISYLNYFSKLFFEVSGLGVSISQSFQIYVNKVIQNLWPCLYFSCLFWVLQGKRFNPYVHEPFHNLKNREKMNKNYVLLFLKHAKFSSWEEVTFSFQEEICWSLPKQGKKEISLYFLEKMDSINFNLKSFYSIWEKTVIFKFELFFGNLRGKESKLDFLCKTFWEINYQNWWKLFSEILRFARKRNWSHPLQCGWEGKMQSLQFHSNFSFFKTKNLSYWKYWEFIKRGEKLFIQNSQKIRININQKEQLPPDFHPKKK